MKFFSYFPLRQKVLLGLTMVIGLGIFIYVLLTPSNPDLVDEWMFCYGISIPILLLVSPTVIDLDNTKIYLAWLILASVLLLVSICTFHPESYSFLHSEKFEGISRLDIYIKVCIVDHSISALKALFFFLLIYWLLNTTLKKITGKYIINIVRQPNWFNTIANRKITGVDVVINIVLIITIFMSALIGH